MEFEPELKAMNDVYDALKSLEDEAKKRVIDWVIGKFSLGPQKRRLGGWPEERSEEFGGNKVEFASFKSVADLFANANPKTDADKVLITAAYLQETKNLDELAGREINKQLHHLGYGVGNITAAITSLMNKRPQLMIQTRKEGRTKQAQKKYKVTTEGTAAAKKMIFSGEQDKE
jgi:hypothetical protein